MKLSTLLARAKFEYRSFVSRHPWLAPLRWPIVWWTQYKMWGIIPPSECRVGSDTEFVLDGFQGSGNSYATVAFKSVQSSPVRIAHHLHSPAEIIKAVQMDIPTVVTVRHPRGAVVSLVSRWPYVTLHQALRSYIGFYETLLPYLDEVVVSPFDQTINHLDDVIEEVNRRYGCNFVPYDVDASQNRKVRDETTLESEAEQQRQKRKERSSEELNNREYQALLARAEGVFYQVEAHGVGRGKEEATVYEEKGRDYQSPAFNDR